MPVPVPPPLFEVGLGRSGSRDQCGQPAPTTVGDLHRSLRPVSLLVSHPLVRIRIRRRFIRTVIRAQLSPVLLLAATREPPRQAHPHPAGVFDASHRIHSVSCSSAQCCCCTALHLPEAVARHTTPKRHKREETPTMGGLSPSCTRKKEKIK